MPLNRTDLQTLLETTLGSGEVYFQPPSTTKLKYPCIIYTRDSASTSFANNRLYRFQKRYKLTVVTKDPDSTIPDKIQELPKCSFERHYTSDNLNHDVFNIYF